MFSDRINWINLIFFTGCGVRLEKRPDEAVQEQSRFQREKDTKAADGIIA